MSDLNAMKVAAKESLIRDGKLSADDVIKATIETRSLRVPLSDTELLEVADSLSKSLGEIESIAEEKKSMSSHYDAQIKAINAKVSNLRALIRDKYDWRKVDCVEVANNTRGSAIVVRMDNLGIIIERGLTADERQSKLFEESEE